MTIFRRIMLAVALVWVGLVAGGAGGYQPSKSPIPLLAYYYIWFEESSWERAKTDYPLLGNYSSDDRAIVVQHIRWARQAGVDGFIVSWKHTDVLDPRLDTLVEVAAEEDFKLVIIYQGLDFERDPLPADRIAEDLKWFVEKYGSNPVFNLFEKPVVIWSGTWKFSVEEIARAAGSVRPELLVLGSERNLDGYRRIASAVDGNAYYWSSVNPETFPGYLEKLQGMAEAIHADGGLWIAPAAPGFDARLIGGTRVVERLDGQTLLRQLQVAYGSAPDAVGLISWNEFSENTHVEPSRNYGTRYLELLADISEVPLPEFDTFNSSDPVPEPEPEPETLSVQPLIPPREWGLLTAGGLLLLVLVGIAVYQRTRSD